MQRYGAIGFILVGERDAGNSIAIAHVLIGSDILKPILVNVRERIGWNAAVARRNDLNGTRATVGNPHHAWCAQDLSVHGERSL